MLIYLGNGVSVRSGDILSLHDLSRALSGDTCALLSRLEKSGSVRRISGSPKTLVLTVSGKSCTAFLTHVGLRTLRRRAGLTEQMKRIRSDGTTGISDDAAND